MVGKMGCIVQARMGSSRLPGKVLKVLADKTVLVHILTRLAQTEGIDQVIVATSVEYADDTIEKECKKYGFACFRGSEQDVLGRYYETAKQYNLKHIIRVCADNTLIDWKIIEREIQCYKEDETRIVKTGDHIPLGLGGEIFSFDKLEEAFLKAKKIYQREHVTPYLYEQYRDIHCYQIEKDYSKYRFTLDTEEDWLLIQKIYAGLYHGCHDFCLDEVVNFMEMNPMLYEINRHVVQTKAGDNE